MTETDFLRHLLATLAYRGWKTLRGAPEGFAAYTGGGKPPLAIVAHLGDLLEWTLTMVQGEPRWHAAEPGTWEEETARFHRALEALDQRLGSGEPPRAEAARLFQGPLADALTHVGQLAMLRRMAGSPISGENYFVADIVAGHLGPDQAAPRKAF